MNPGSRTALQVSLLAFFVLLSWPQSGIAQTSPPSLTALSFTPTAINTSAGPATVTVNFTANASGSGILYLETAFVDPTGVYAQRAFKLFNPPMAPRTDSVAITFPAFSPQGAWKLAYVFIADSGGNTLFLDSNGLAASGFAGTLQVSSVADTTPPNLTAFSISPASINTTPASANAAVGFSLTDDLSGANFVQVTLTSPSGNQSQSASVPLTAAATVTNAATVTFPRFSEAGTWTVSSVFASDAAGNTLLLDSAALAARGFSNTLSVISTNDTTAPVLKQLSITPASINVTGATATVTANFQVTDDLSGATSFQMVFVSQSGATSQTATATFAANTSLTGTAAATFPKGSENGTWSIAFVFLSDASGNTRILATADLAALGFPTQVSVVNGGADTTPPVIVPTVTPGPNVFGWNTTVPVNVSWSVTDPESGINSSTGCGATSLQSETSGLTFTCSATNGAGLTGSASITVRVDLSPPIVTPALSSAPNAAGWNNSGVTLSWGLNDPISGIDSELTVACDPASLAAETSGTIVTCTATNGAGISRSVSVTVKIDLTRPTAVATSTPAANPAGWNNTNVTVTFTGVDSLSGISGCTAPVILSAEATGQSASGVCTDFAGNVSLPASLTGIKIDKTAPVVTTIVATPNPLQVGVGTTLTATISDLLSGVASAQFSINGGAFSAMTGTFGGATASVSAPIPAFSTDGLRQLCARGTDVAGNVGATNCIVLAVFDPSAGFITGGGGSTSPAGADLANPTGTGPVTFGFNVKYLPNSTVPSGDVEFHYNAGNINFKSTGFDYLIVTTEPRAQIQGTGTINGSTVCKFSIDAWEGSFQPGNSDALGFTIFNCSGGTGNRYILATKPTSQGSIKVHDK